MFHKLFGSKVVSPNITYNVVQAPSALPSLLFRAPFPRAQSTTPPPALSEQDFITAQIAINPTLLWTEMWHVGVHVLFSSIIFTFRTRKQFLNTHFQVWCQYI